MAQYVFVRAYNTWTDIDIEREHMAGEPVEVRMARLSTAEEIERETADADGIVVTTDPLPRDFIERLGPKVRVIARAGIGLDAIDLEAARERRIAVYHCPDYATEEVATHALSLILALNRHSVQANELARHDWKGWQVMKPVHPLSEQTIGVLGSGRIGRALIERLRPLFGTILAYDPYVTEVPEGAEKVDRLEDLFPRCDVLTLHLPLTDETRGILGEDSIDMLPRGAMVVNVSRGGLIDEAALVRGLESGQIGGAGLDVLQEEPAAPDAPILRAPNVILSPHFAWYSSASERRARTMAMDGMLDYLEGRPQRGGRLAVVPD